MFCSTILPANAADIPKKNIAMLNAHPTENVLIPIVSAIACLNVLQQYTVPIEQWISRAGIAALSHLLFIVYQLLLIVYLNLNLHPYSHTISGFIRMCAVLLQSKNVPHISQAMYPLLMGFLHFGQ
jgi:hypothetical protein